MTLSQEIITIGMVVLGTALTRYLPFLLFPAGKPTPKYIQYLGKVLPGAVFGLLVIYSLRNVRSEERRVGKECRSRWSPYH